MCVSLRGFSLSPPDCAYATSLSTSGERHTEPSSARHQTLYIIHMHMSEGMLNELLWGFFLVVCAGKHRAGHVKETLWGERSKRLEQGQGHSF